MTEPFDPEEANWLVSSADAIEREFLDVGEMGARIDAEWLDAQRAGDDEAYERARAESRRLAALCAERERLWRALCEALEDMDIRSVRVKAAVIRQTAEDQFRRRQA
jgi:hypothetical protein